MTNIKKTDTRASRHLYDQAITSKVPQAVIDHLETVQVDEKDGEFLPATAITPRQGLVQSVEEQSPVGKPGRMRDGNFTRASIVVCENEGLI